MDEALVKAAAVHKGNDAHSLLTYVIKCEGNGACAVRSVRNCNDLHRNDTSSNKMWYCAAVMQLVCYTTFVSQADDEAKSWTVFIVARKVTGKNIANYDKKRSMSRSIINEANNHVWDGLPGSEDWLHLEWAFKAESYRKTGGKIGREMLARFSQWNTLKLVSEA